MESSCPARFECEKIEKKNGRYSKERNKEMSNVLIDHWNRKRKDAERVQKQRVSGAGAQYADAETNDSADCFLRVLGNFALF